MKVKSLLLKGDSNVGLHVFPTNNYVLVGVELSVNEKKELEEVFKTPVHKLTIGGTSLLGVFIAGNEKKILVPSIIFESEKKVLDKLKIDYEIFSTEQTCVGNNLVVGEDSAIAHIDFSIKEVEFIKKSLGLKSVKQMTIADAETVGSCVVKNSKGGVVHRFASTEEIKILNKAFGINFGIGTVNMGGPLVRSGVACNDNGFIIGKNSGGPEMVNVDENLEGNNE